MPDRPDPAIVDCRGWLGLGLGSNLGNREAQLRQALIELSARFGALRVAPLYRTAPISQIPQSDYLNTVALCRLPEHAESPADSGERLAWAVRHALGFVKSLEHEAGRRAAARDSPRPLDIDLLFWGEHRLSLPASEAAEPLWHGAIEIPHQRLQERRFVLAPLADLAPRLGLPSGSQVSDLLLRVADQPVAQTDWSTAELRT